MGSEPSSWVCVRCTFPNTPCRFWHIACHIPAGALVQRRTRQPTLHPKIRIQNRPGVRGDADEAGVAPDFDTTALCEARHPMASPHRVSRFSERRKERFLYFTIEKELV